jgi:hypothetical protein
MKEMSDPSSRVPACRAMTTDLRGSNPMELAGGAEPRRLSTPP